MNRLHVKYLLVGGGLASSSAAKAIREIDPDGALMLIGLEVNRPYDRPPLSKEFLRGQKAQAELYTLPEDWFEKNQVELRTGCRAAQLDPGRHSVLLDNGDHVVFDRLLIATGGSPKHLDVPGGSLPNVYYLRTIEDAGRLHHGVEKAMKEGRPHEKGRGKATVIGGGVLGVELAASLTQMGLGVDLVFPSGHPWNRFAGETTGRFLTRFLEQRGVKVHSQCSVQRLEGDGRAQRVVLSEKQSLECDFVVPAIGMTPHKELLRGTSIAAERAILVDQHCQTSHPDIYAAGDCAAVLDPLFGKYRIMEHWQSAIDTGTLAGRNMAGINEAYSTVNYFFSDVFELALSGWGESRHIARRIVRGSPNLEKPDFIEIGISADGRVSQVLAINHTGEDELLKELVQRRLSVDGNEERLKDPQTELASLLG